MILAVFVSTSPAVRLLHMRIDVYSTESVSMKCRTVGASLFAALTVAIGSSVHAQTGAETFTATATIKTGGGATASAPVTIVVDRKVSSAEADRVTAAFTQGGASELHKALEALPAAGSIRLGGGKPAETRLTLERRTDKGRLLTILSNEPMLFLGAGVPGAASKEGFDFAIADIEVDENGDGSGTLCPAAKITVKQGAFIVADYGSELVRLTNVKKVK